MKVRRTTPDLTVESFAVSPAEVAQGEEATCSFLIRNAGPGGALPFAFEIRLDSGTILHSERRALNLGPGEKFSGQCSFRPHYERPGGHTLTLLIDPRNEVRETNELNNVQRVVLKIKQTA